MKKLIKHFKRWNKWRKGSLNSPIYKVLVLLNILKSPTFNLIMADDEAAAFYEEFTKAVLKELDHAGNVDNCLREKVIDLDNSDLVEFGFSKEAEE